MFRILILLLATFPLCASTLDGLIDYAMKNSTVIKQSKAQIQLSDVQRKENQALQLGSIDLVGSYTHYNVPRTLIPLTPGSLLSDPNAAKAIATTKDFFGTGVKYSVPLFTGFSQTRQVEMDSIATELSKSKLSLTKEQLAYNVASLYLSILALKDMSYAQKKHVDALEKLKNMIQKEVSFGKKAEIDLLKAENDLYGNISYLEVLKGNITMTKASLASLVGLKHLSNVTPIKVSVKKPNYSINMLVEQASKLTKVHISELNIRKASKRVEKKQGKSLSSSLLRLLFWL